MPDAFICDAVRTPIGRYGGALASVRADVLAATPPAAWRGCKNAPCWLGSDRTRAKPGSRPTEEA
jgi:hypothetical protein